MTEPGPITLAYLASHPRDAARVMETLDPAELASFIAEVPVRLAAASLAELAPWRAGRCLAALPPERAGALVEELPPDRRSPCLRAMGEPQREAILEHVPRRRARVLRRQLGYPSALVGAVMVADLVSVSADATIGEAREAVQGAAGRAVLQVYLVDDSGRPRAAIPLASLLTADPGRPARELADRELMILSAEAPLSQVRTDRDWHGHPERPVVDSRQRLVGTVTLERVLATRERPAGAISSGPGPAAVLGRSYLASIAGLLRVAAAIVAGTPGPRS